jgi:alpha-N-acetylglucosaminidase
MALQGINLPMMPLGMEALLQRTFVGLGLTRQQLADFFPGPAFLAWVSELAVLLVLVAGGAGSSSGSQAFTPALIPSATTTHTTPPRLHQGRMGNIQGWAGPLPQAYMDSQLALAHRVVGRMRALGMTPVFPAFAGYIPAALQRLHPEASAAPASTWCHFPPGYCCPLLLDPADPLFGHIGGAYITTLRAELGWDAGGSYYIADTFNEMRPGSADPAYLSSIAASVYGGMTAADPGAHWVMQVCVSWCGGARLLVPADTDAAAPPL